MILQKLDVKNFRSFDEEGISIKFNRGVNLIVGENNVGKTNILQSLEIPNIPQPRSFSTEDYYKGENKREIQIDIVVEFDEKEIKDIVEEIFSELEERPNDIQSIISEFGKEIKLSYSSRRDRIIIKWHGFYLFSNGLYLYQEHLYRSPQQSIAYKEIRQRIIDGGQSITNNIKQKLTFEKEREPPKFVDFNKDIVEIFLNVFNNKLKNFTEVRQRPLGENQEVLESYDGRLVADVLANLKNGNQIQRKIWQEIKKVFHDLFPYLELEVEKPAKNIPRIMIRKEQLNYEVPISHVGAGIWEMIILLTHLFSYENMCFGIDMPELHFHNHTLRLLKKILKEKSLKNQFLIVTHSPILIDPSALENVIVVRGKEGKTITVQLPTDFLEIEDQRKLIRHLDESTREFFFSNRILLVEGETEKGAMPIFAELMGFDFDINGISVVVVGSQHFNIFIKIFKVLDLPYFIMSDYDALMNIYKDFDVNEQPLLSSAVFYNLKNWLDKVELSSLKDMENTITFTTENNKAIRRYNADDNDTYIELKRIALQHNVFILSSNFEGVLEKSGYSELLDEAKKFSSSKVICGRYVAEKIVENRDKKKIPAEFQKVINFLSSIG